ncbi:MAG TPA: ABC transporter ATP-binding protein/permease [Candidatus Fusicatenibacter merdavium]|uniref:ABC transporter ATP-binding protein/permease n=1 Tax=Candidatus Fusicatenibacter merdavium TaxID=2838600 RepID=A0A9D2BIQ8_9FIRM|nr:ABC transporter ATP-binding protein/permease [Candidatus Fusicatenibacter merdavium]
MKKVFYYLRPHVPRMILGVTIKFTGTIMDLFLPWILSYLIDVIVPKENMAEILLYGFLMLVCSVVAWAGNVIANRMASGVARDTTESLRHDLFRRISYLSCRQTDSFTIASLESRLTSDTYNIHQMIGMMQRLGIRAPILLLGGIAMTMFMEPVLTLVLLAVLPFVAVTVFYISKKGIPLYTQLQQAVDRMTRVVRENASGIRVIKALSKTEYEKERFKAANRNIVEKETKANVTMAASNPLMNLFLNTGLTLVVVAGAFRVYGGKTQTGTILAFLTYFTIILNAMLSINRMFMLFSKGSASAKRISEVLDAPEDLETGARDHQDSEYHIQFDHVSFAYHSGRANVLTDISFALKKGETLGIIGATGCGKSTIINLLIRFYDADQGTIRIDGDDVCGIPFSELHEKFGIVFQNDVLFADTVEENIRFGRDISQEEIDQAIECAQARPFIEELEDGLGYRLAIRGSNLSGGQKQRVLISRALASHPEILILDDSSSALDYQTDARLRQALSENFSGTTTIIVAQRASSIRHADHILMLENGKEIGYGTHEELMATCEPYRRISISQMGGDGYEAV